MSVSLCCYHWYYRTQHSEGLGNILSVVEAKAKEHNITHKLDYCHTCQTKLMLVGCNCTMKLTIPGTVLTESNHKSENSTTGADASGKY